MTGLLTAVIKGLGAVVKSMQTAPKKLFFPAKSVTF